MGALAYRDFYDPRYDADCCDAVVAIYRRQFPSLYLAAESGDIRTSAGKPMALRGDTLITYKMAIRRIYGKHFFQLPSSTKLEIRRVLESYSYTPSKSIECWDEQTQNIINNHQIGNMMPFPSGVPSLNRQRAQSPLYDAFDGFLAEVEGYYSSPDGWRPESVLQEAIHHYRGYFDFFGSYDKFIEVNLLEDFLGKDLSAITDFQEYVAMADGIIDSRSRRFAQVG